MQSAECRLEQGASTLLGLASPTFVGILTSAFKSATPALIARVGRRCALYLFRPHGFLYCAIDGGLKAFGVRTLCGDLCSESIQRIWWHVYLVAAFQHQLYTIRRKHLFAQLALNPAPSMRIRFVTHISICHSFLVHQEPRLYHVRMVCLMAMGVRWEGVGAGR